MQGLQNPKEKSSRKLQGHHATHRAPPRQAAHLQVPRHGAGMLVAAGDRAAGGSSIAMVPAWRHILVHQHCLRQAGREELNSDALCILLFVG